MTTSTIFPVWRKSSRSGSGDNCVEVSANLYHVAIRDTKNRAGGAMTVTASEWTSWLAAIKSEALDN